MKYKNLRAYAEGILSMAKGLLTKRGVLMEEVVRAFSIPGLMIRHVMRNTIDYALVPEIQISVESRLQFVVPLYLFNPKEDYRDHALIAVDRRMRDIQGLANDWTTEN